MGFVSLGFSLFCLVLGFVCLGFFDPFFKSFCCLSFVFFAPKRGKNISFFLVTWKKHFFCGHIVEKQCFCLGHIGKKQTNTGFCFKPRKK